MCLSSCHTEQCQSKCLQDCAKNDHDVWSCLAANCDWKCRCHPPQSYLDKIKELKASGELSEDGSIYRPKNNHIPEAINVTVNYKLNPEPRIMNELWISKDK
jgi:hypothetical protein